MVSAEEPRHDERQPQYRIDQPGSAASDGRVQVALVERVQAFRSLFLCSLHTRPFVIAAHRWRARGPAVVAVAVAVVVCPASLPPVLELAVLSPQLFPERHVRNSLVFFQYHTLPDRRTFATQVAYARERGHVQRAADDKRHDENEDEREHVMRRTATVIERALVALGEVKEFAPAEHRKQGDDDIERPHADDHNQRHRVVIQLGVLRRPPDLQEFVQGDYRKRMRVCRVAERRDDALYLTEDVSHGPVPRQSDMDTRQRPHDNG